MRASSFPLLLVLWGAAFWTHAFGQISSSRPNATSSASTSSSPTASLTFAALPTLTACQSAPIQWSLSGADLSRYNLTIQAVGTTGNASTLTAPSPAASKAAQPIYRLITTQPAISTQINYLVKLPFGRYYLNGRVNDPSGTSVNSPLFWVVEGSDTSCLDENAVSASSSSSTAATVSSTRSAAASRSASASTSNGVAAEAGSGSSSDSKGGLSAGAIAGVVIGALAGIAVLVFAILFCIRRRKNRDVEASNPDMASRGSSAFGNPFGGPAIAGDRSRQDSRHAAHHGHNDARNEGHFALTSMGDSAEGGEKDEGPFVGSFGSEASTTVDLAQGPTAAATPRRPSTPPKQDPFASVPSTPRPDDSAAFGLGLGPAPNVSSSVKENRRQSQPSPKSPHSLSERSRSNSQPSNGPSGQVGVMRTTSARRKPVPSLGAELREELRNETSQRHLRETARRQDAGPREELEGPSQKETLRSSYQLMPVPPRPINE